MYNTAIALGLHLLAVTGGSSSNTIEIVAYIGIPLFLAFIGAVIAAIKGSVRFTQYMTRSEETQKQAAESQTRAAAAQASIATSNNDISNKLSQFIEKTNDHLSVHDKEIAVIMFALREAKGLAWPHNNHDSDGS